MHVAIGLSPLVSVERLWRQINSFLLAESYAFARTSQLNAHPGTFRLKNDPKGALQYGLIAEEVAKVYPELVLRNASGRIDGVRYDELAPMLLNEVQQQQRRIDAQAHINAAQAAQLRDVQQKLGNLQVALTKLQAKEELVANR
jgi:hypothetical protein